jgi:hypothetical protein
VELSWWPFGEGVTVGAAWVMYGFEPQLFLYAVAVAVGLAVFSLVMVWLWGSDLCVSRALVR